MKSRGKEGRSPVELGLSVISIVSVVLFTRIVPEAYDLPKAAWVLVTVPLLAAFGAMHRSLRPNWNSDRVVGGVACVFAIAILVSAMRNPSRQLAFIGQEHRYTGSIFWLVCVLAAALAYLSSREGSFRRFATWISLGSAPFLLYGILQMYGRDPWEWNTPTFSGNYIFSTQGNPNFASWTTALVFGCGICVATTSTTRWKSVGALLVSLVSVVLSVRTVSIQGLVGIALLIGIWLLVSVGNAFRSGSWSRSLAVTTLAVSMLLSYLARNHGGLIWLPALFGLVVWLVVERTELKLSRRHGVVVLSSAVALSTVVVVAFFSRIVTWLGQQGGERTAFYRAAAKMFADQPVLGHGFDRYGRLFTRYRPDWHAERLSTSISSSAHSMWLGLAVSGGLLLVLPILFLVFRSWRTSFREMKSSAWNDDRTGLFALAVVLPVIWFVSVEQASIILVTFVVLGFALAAGRTSSGGKSTKVSWRRGITSALLACLFVLTSILSVRWMAGNKAQGDSYRELFGNGNIERGLELLDRAVTWGPQPSEVRAVRGNVYTQLGNADVATKDALWVAEEFEFSGAGSVESARILLQFGRVDDAKRVLQESIANNANNPYLVEEASALLAQIP